MPCQDTLYLMRMGDDPSFAEASTKYGEASGIAMRLEELLCRVGRLVAKGLPVGNIEIPPIPREPRGSFSDEWGARIKSMALKEIDRARTAAMHLRSIRDGKITEGCREWLAEHWRLDLRRLEADNERHKREIQTPHYSSGPKYEKRIARIAKDTPEIAELRDCIGWSGYR